MNDEAILFCGKKREKNERMITRMNLQAAKLQMIIEGQSAVIGHPRKFRTDD